MHSTIKRGSRLASGASCQPHTQVPSSNNSAASTCEKQMQHVLKAMPSIPSERAKTLHGEPNGYLWQRWGATSSPHYSLLRHQTTVQCANLATNNHHPDAT